MVTTHLLSNFSWNRFISNNFSEGFGFKRDAMIDSKRDQGASLIVIIAEDDLPDSGNIIC